MRTTPFLLNGPMPGLIPTVNTLTIRRKEKPIRIVTMIPTARPGLPAFPFFKEGGRGIDTELAQGMTEGSACWEARSSLWDKEGSS